MATWPVTTIQNPSAVHRQRQPTAQKTEPSTSTLLRCHWSAIQPDGTSPSTIVAAKAASVRRIS